MSRNSTNNQFNFGLKRLMVKCENNYIGTLAIMDNGQIAFEYDSEWLANGFSISPFSLPLEKKVFIPVKHHFEGLFGIFADSLPDNWGRILMDKFLMKQGKSLNASVLDRLAIIGKSGMGLLEYEPDYSFTEKQAVTDLDYLSGECMKLLKTDYSDNLDSLFRLGYSSGGARPKIMTTIDDKDWIIKFPAPTDPMDIGLQEYQYSLCAKKCGISMPDTRLFPSEKCSGYFGTLRFDLESRDGVRHRIHTATAAALLEADYNSPCLDYHELMKLTRILTADNTADIENMFRRACFNVFAHNRDDHAKNFSFIYNIELDTWSLSPAYDLTFSSTFYGEHTTSVDNNGRDPGPEELMRVGTKAGMKPGKCREIIDEIQAAVFEFLGEYLR